MPLLDELDAAIAWGYRIDEWWELPRPKQVYAVAHFYMRQLMHNHTEDAVMSASARERAAQD